MFHITPPDDFRADLEVAGCFVRFRERFVLLERAGNCRWGGCWDFPGGVKQAQEDPRQASVREIEEETGIRVEPSRLDWIGKFFFCYPELSFTYDLFAVKLRHKPVIQINPTEHDQSLWVRPNEALNFRLLSEFDNLIALFFARHQGGDIGIHAGSDQSDRRPSGRRQPRMR